MPGARRCREHDDAGSTAMLAANSRHGRFDVHHREGGVIDAQLLRLARRLQVCDVACVHAEGYEHGWVAQAAAAACGSRLVFEAHK